MIRTLALLAACALGFASPTRASQDVDASIAPPEGPLNVLVVMLDQMHYACLGSSGNGFGGVASSLTPALDGLAEGGARFTRAYASQPQCCPARFSIVTGLAPRSHGVRWNAIWTPRDRVTLPELARAAGYATASIGKNHFYWLRQPAPLDYDMGFDHIVDEEDYSAHCAAHGVASYQHPSRTVLDRGLPGPIHSTGYTRNAGDLHPVGYWAKRTIEYLEQRAADGQPFVLYYSNLAPHAPILPTGPDAPEDWAHRYAPAQLELPPNHDDAAVTWRLHVKQLEYSGMSPREHALVLARYYGLIAQVDHEIGRVLQRLRELGLERRTLVLFTADHGELASESGGWLKGAGMMEGLTRVPLLMRLPGVVASGTVSDALVGHEDLVPTIASVASIPVADHVRATWDGLDLLDVLRGDAQRAYYFSEYSSHEIATERAYAVHGPRYVYSKDYLLGPWETFHDLLADPWQRHDLVASTDPTDQAHLTAMRQAADQVFHLDPRAPDYPLTGNELALPGPIADPLPSDGATDVEGPHVLSWTPSTGASHSRLLIGTTATALQPVADLPPMTGEHAFGWLAPGTTYFWVVENTNHNGTRQYGPFRFTTKVEVQGPRAAYAPQPAHTSAGVPLDVALTWSSGTTATSQTLHFGPRGATQPVWTGPINASNTWSPPAPLEGGREYEWRVETVGVAGLIATSSTWTFTTDTSGLLAPADRPRPRHLSSGWGAGARRVEWRPVQGATGYVVHAGTNFPLPVVATVTNPHALLTQLPADTSIYWRVDVVGGTGVRTGVTWRFRTD